MNQEQYLKENLPRAPYYFEQTGIAEIAPRPTPATLSLLSKIYGPGGPVDSVYAKYGVRYAPKDTFRIFGNQLYVDREKELRTILPAYSYFASQPWHPKLATTKGAWVTVKNIFALQNINPQIDKGLALKLDAELKRVSESETKLGECLDEFRRAYALVFEINLKAEKAVERLALVLKKYEFNTADILASPETFDFYRTPEIEIDPLGWQGNSLELGDASVFSRQTLGGRTKAADSWWQGLKEGQRQFLKPSITDALFFHDMREMGRWLAVGHVNRLRSQIFAKAASCGFRRSENALFASLDETQVCLPEEAVCEKRRQEHQGYMVWDLPTAIRSDRPAASRAKGVGLAPGKAVGKLVAAEDPDHSHGDVILYTKLLTPDLASYLNQVKGIVSERGSLLSHLAILAREKGIPLVTNISLESSGLKIGDEIAVDGSAGTVSLV